MPLSFALSSGIHLESVPTTYSCVSGGCLLVLYFRGAELTLCTSPDAVLPGGIPWLGCRKMFLRIQREITWKTWPVLPQGLSFPWEKSKDWERKMAYIAWLCTREWHFTNRKSASSLSCFSSPAKMGQAWCEVITERISGGKLSTGAFSRILEALHAILPAVFLLEVFLRIGITLAGMKIFQKYGVPIPSQVRLLIWAYGAWLWWEPGEALSPGCWAVGQGDLSNLGIRASRIPGTGIWTIYLLQYTFG